MPVPFSAKLWNWCNHGQKITTEWWRHQMETISALLALCVGNSPVTGEFPSQRPVTRSFDVFFDLRLNRRLSKQSRGWWFDTLLRSLWRRCNGWETICGLTMLCYIMSCGKGTSLHSNTLLRSTVYLQLIKSPARFYGMNKTFLLADLSLFNELLLWWYYNDKRAYQILAVLPFKMSAPSLPWSLASKPWATSFVILQISCNIFLVFKWLLIMRSYHTTAKLSVHVWNHDLIWWQNKIDTQK